MNESLTKSSLTSARKHLLVLMQRLNFGRIEGLAVRGGQPVFNPVPRLLREVKFGGENGPRPESAAADFTLKVQVVELFRQLDEIGDGTVELIEVKHGLPFRMVFAEAGA